MRLQRDGSGTEKIDEEQVNRDSAMDIVACANTPSSPFYRGSICMNYMIVAPHDLLELEQSG